jgi:hypothetical protein
MPALLPPTIAHTTPRTVCVRRNQITVNSNAASKRYLAQVARTGDDDADYAAGQKLADRIRGLMLDQQDGSMLRDMVIAMVQRGSFGMVEAGFLDGFALAAML